MRRPTSDLRFCWRILQQARGYWPHLALITVLALLAAPLTLLTPLPLMLAVDSVIGSHPLPSFIRAFVPDDLAHSRDGRLAIVVVMLIATAFLKQAQGFASWILQLYTGEKMVLDFRSHLFRHAQRLSLAYHDGRGVADSLYRIQYDTAAMQYLIMQGMLPMVTAIATLIALLWVTARIDWTLALLSVAIAPILFAFAELYRHRVRNRWAGIKQLESSTMAVIQEVLGALRVVKAFGQEEREQSRFLHRANQSLGAQIRVVVLESIFGLLVALTIAAGTAAVLVVAIHRVEAGVLTIGQLLIVMAYVAQLYQPLATISRTMTDVQAALASAERAFALLDESPDVEEVARPRPINRARGEITFEHVSFCYGSERAILEDLSFTIPAGASVGLSGATGAGKTTLVSLLPRFLDPTAGRVLLDGFDVREYRLQDLRNQFAIVLQEPVLFSASIAENIAYGRPGATEADIIAAARSANIHEFIVGLPQGYETEVGERGMTVSGGERQRLSLARAFLRDAPVLILDEPTSSVDVEAEAIILEAMQRLMRGRTVFLIAHRSRTLESCTMRMHLAARRLSPVDAPGDSVSGKVRYAS